MNRPPGPSAPAPGGDPWAAFGYLVAGVGLYGAIGWVLSVWLHAEYWIPIGILFGAGIGLYMVFARYLIRGSDSDEDSATHDDTAEHDTPEVDTTEDVTEDNEITQDKATTQGNDISTDDIGGGNVTEAGTPSTATNDTEATNEAAQVRRPDIDDRGETA